MTKTDADSNFSESENNSEVLNEHTYCFSTATCMEIIDSLEKKH